MRANDIMISMTEIELNKNGVDLSALADNNNDGGDGGDDDIDELEDGFEDEEEIKDPVPLTPEELKYRRTLITKLRGYVAKFQKYFRGVDVVEFNHMSISELEKTLESVRYQVCCGNNNSMIHMGAEFGLGLVETIGMKFTPLKLDGFADRAKSDEGIIDIINEIAIEYSDQTYSPPEQRLIYSLLKVCGTTHFMNTKKEAHIDVELDKKLSEKIPEDILANSKDL